VAHEVTLIPGDGTGPELTEATRRVLEATGAEFEWDVQQAGADVMDQFDGNPLPEQTLESIRRTGMRGYYGVPMMLGEELVGVATIGSRHAAEFSEEDRLLFRTMSGRAAALIAKARLNAELTRRNAELSAALDYRDRMLGVLSHDLKNPLGVILASSYVLEKAALEDAQKRSLARVTSAAGRIDRMINDLLDYTRTRMDRALPIARREVDLLEVCKQAMDELRLLNPRRVIRLDCQGPMTGSFDPDRVARAVGNLVNNALRYGDPDAPIDVSLRRASPGIVLEVHNQGTPIRPDLLPHLFEAFQRGPDADGEGLGLGLYIVKQIVDAHGGSITVRSSQAEGTTFSVPVSATIGPGAYAFRCLVHPGMTGRIDVVAAGQPIPSPSQVTAAGDAQLTQAAQAQALAAQDAAAVTTTRFDTMPTELIGSLNCTAMRAFSGTPVAPFCGPTATTAGVAVSGVCAVVNPLWKKLIPLPARSVTPLVFTRTVYPVEGCSALAANTALSPSAEGVTVPLIGMPVLFGHI